MSPSSRLLVLGFAQAFLAMTTRVDVTAQSQVARSVASELSYEASEEVPRITQALIAQASSGPNSRFGLAASFAVTNTNDTGAGSLRKAILDANASPGLDIIGFAIGSGPAIIYPKSQFPTITSPVIIDGTTQGGFTGSPLITIDGKDISIATDCLIFGPGAAGSTIRGVVLSFFPGNGVVLNGNSCVVEGCYIGTTADGLYARGNAAVGVWVENASNCRVGGTTAAQKNLISGNGQFGIIIRGNSSADTVQGNNIGTNVNGSSIVKNTWDGIRLNVFSGFGASNCLIGGTAAGAPNIVAGNDSGGVVLYGSTVTNNRVVGNYIGTNPAGSTTLGNGGDGVRFWNSSTGTGGTASSNTIGGTAPLEGNIIAANRGNGIRMTGRTSGGSNNKIFGNFIGRHPSVSGSFGNGHHGISINALTGGTVTGTLIGGLSPDSANIISGNHGAGVSVTDIGVSRTRIIGNAIYGNDSLGIDLGLPGITPNDTLDTDTGPNTLQNLPIIDSVKISGGKTYISGSLMAAPSSPFRIDLYISPTSSRYGFGEAKTHFGGGVIRTDAGGIMHFKFMWADVVPADSFITATATDSLGNTSEVSQAFSYLDSDGDGIYDFWESPGWGIDVNSDGIIDQDLYAKGANKNHKDVFVEVDAMVGLQPLPGVLDSVHNAFAVVPNTYVSNPRGDDGINLHIDPLDADTLIPIADFPQRFTDFASVKKNRFGTVQERADPNHRYILEAKKLVYRYCIFARTFGAGDELHSSGLAETPGDDFMVTLGTWPLVTLDMQAGTFMHELGHALGLNHGGGDEKNYKPNYYSVMNYTWQMPDNWFAGRGWRLNYSPVALATLDESHLTEIVGLNPPPGVFPVVSVPFRDGTGHVKYARLDVSSPADWSGDGFLSWDPTTSADINHLAGAATPGEQLNGYADWPNLQYSFRDSPGFTSGVLPDSIPLPVEQDYTTYLTIQSFPPPPKPTGSFQMDGVLDGSAVPLLSNSGVTLYAAVDGNLLYVATNSAQSLGRDVFIFIAGSQRSLRSAPWQKGGNVGNWMAALGNRTTDNSSEWFDANGVVDKAFSNDTAGAVLEGVVDLGLFTQARPTAVFLAVGTFAAGTGGILVSQVPVGNGNGDIDPAEFYDYTTTALPIQLASFVASVKAAGVVRLEWKTISEVNNYGFEIQRTGSGTMDFATLPGGFVAGRGTTNTPQLYHFIDTLAQTGKHWYRLKQIDLDGTVHYSEMVLVDATMGTLLKSVPQEFGLDQNTPNPFNPVSTVGFSIAEPRLVTLKVYDLLGREVAMLVNENKMPGRYEVIFDGSGLASGMYVYRLTAGSFVQSRKMLLLK